MNDDELSQLIRQQASQFKASGRLRAEVRTRIALESASHATAGAGSAHPKVRPKLWRERGWRTAMAGFALGVVVTMAFMRLVPLPETDIASKLDAEVVTEHVRSLRVGPLIQVASTDRHTVKPWFQGKLDYAPPVLNLAAGGFPLLGGRVELVNGESVATLVYTHHQHILNLFVWPATTQQAVQRRQSKGFNVLHWSDGTMQYWLVTDMDATEVNRFGQIWHEEQGKP